MISSVIAGILITAINSFLSNSLKAQKLIEKRGLRKEIVDHYVFKLNDPKIKDFTKTHSANAILKAHVNGSAPQPLTAMPSSLADIPSPLYPSESSGITIYETASKVLIPQTGLLLNSLGVPCAPTPCTTQQARWKVLVKWAALDNRSYDFYLSISDIYTGTKEVSFKIYSRLLSQLDIRSNTFEQIVLTAYGKDANGSMAGRDLRIAHTVYAEKLGNVYQNPSSIGKTHFGTAIIIKGEPVPTSISSYMWSEIPERIKATLFSRSIGVNPGRIRLRESSGNFNNLIFSFQTDDSVRGVFHITIPVSEWDRSNATDEAGFSVGNDKSFFFYKINNRTVFFVARSGAHNAHNYDRLLKITGIR